MVLLFAGVNPFEQLGFIPADGQGLNPQLQNYWMTIHPPILYLGFTAFAIPFAFAMAALLNGQTDSRWIVLTRRWTLVSWFFLSNGIIFGMRWAYEELGWGGYWFWDPVENASLLPWLTATAFLHSIMIQENRGMLKVWNMSLVLLTFLLTIFATFLTRSGLIESVHSFAQNTKIAIIFLAFMGSILIASVILIVYRLAEPEIGEPDPVVPLPGGGLPLQQPDPAGGRLRGPLGHDLPPGERGVHRSADLRGPALLQPGEPPHRPHPPGADRDRSRHRLAEGHGAEPEAELRPSRGAWVRRCVVAFLALGVRNGYALATFGISSFVLTVIVVEFWKGTRARARIEGEGIVSAFVHLVGRNRRRWGGYIVHVGIVLIFTAFAGRAFEVEVRKSLNPGETVTVASPFGHTYTLTYEGISSSREGNFDRWVALMSVQKDEKRWGP